MRKPVYKNMDVVYGLYDDEEIMMDAVRQAKKDHLDIMDVYSPFPVHGLDPILGSEVSHIGLYQHLFRLLLSLLYCLLRLGWL